MIIQSIGEPVSDSNLEAFENQLGFKIPKDYKEFLKKYNGGTFLNEYYCCYPEGTNEVIVDVFFGIGVDKNCDISYISNELKDDMPKNSLIIGRDGVGGLILFVLKDSDAMAKGIYYWDDSHLLPTSDDKKNCYFVSNSFSEFIESLELFDER